MLIQRFRRFGIMLLPVAVLSGCSLGSFGGADSSSGFAGECAWSRSRCMYEGSYESGERDYAEQEARRLNQAALERLQRNAVR
jgi:hypothetical protein